jgi:hypothetical protein
MHTITRRQSDNERCEQWEAEVIGGPEDGIRLVLEVVRDAPNEIRVLETGYEKKFKVLRASEVEQET